MEFGAHARTILWMSLKFVWKDDVSWFEHRTRCNRISFFNEKICTFNRNKNAESFKTSSLIGNIWGFWVKIEPTWLNLCPDSTLALQIYTLMLLALLYKNIIVMERENNHPNISLYTLELLSKYLFSRFYSHWGSPKVHYFFKINNSYFHLWKNYCSS